MALAFAYLDIRDLDLPVPLPAVLFTGAILARNLFSAMVGALLTMITVSFSTIMVVLTLYSGQFTPRITRDFIQGRVPMRVLGVFMGSFVFSIVSLYSLDKAADEHSLLSPFVGVILAMACLAFFGYFIQHVARSVQINHIIDGISQDITRAVQRDIDEIEESDTLKRYFDERPEDLSAEPLVEIPIPEAGFVNGIDYPGLVQVASEHDVMLNLETRVGEYLEEDDIAATVYAYSGADPSVDNLSAEIAAKLSCGTDRDSTEDVEFGIIILVEVALRAISPGINDPNTAIYCISKLGPILRMIGRELESLYYHDEDSVMRLHVQNLEFSDLLYGTYQQLRVYGKGDVSVLGALLDSISVIADGEQPVATNDLWELAHYLVSGLDIDSIPDMDRRYLNRKIRDLARTLSADPSELLLTAE